MLEWDTQLRQRFKRQVTKRHSTTDIISQDDTIMQTSKHLAIDWIARDKTSTDSKIQCYLKTIFHTFMQWS
jgi:hypothetical protein